MAHLVELEQELGAVQEALQIAGGAERWGETAGPRIAQTSIWGRNTGWGPWH